MISGDGWGLNFPEICLTVEEKPQQRFLAHYGWLLLLLAFVPQDFIVFPWEYGTRIFMHPRNGNPMVPGQVSEGARLLGLHVPSICCQKCHSSGDTTSSCGTNEIKSWSHQWYAENVSKRSAWPGIEPGPARWETMVLPLDHSGGLYAVNSGNSQGCFGQL